MILPIAQGSEPASAAHTAPPARVFVGIKVAPEIAAQLAELAIGLERPFARPVAADDIHLTLVPPWNERSVPDAIEKLGRVAARFGAFTLIIEHVGYGPQPRRPRLLWSDCAAGAEITALLEAFGQTEERAFQPHVTLARIRGAGTAIARNHPIDQQLALTQRVQSVELFQSPPPGGHGYKVLASLPLGAAASSGAVRAHRA
jgi:RNA 2',3'-cyclic 3'-phosphodiesterase